MKSPVLLLMFGLLFVSVSLAQTTDSYQYTYTDMTGNRYIANATGNFPGVGVAGVQFQAQPLWVLGGVVEDAPIWTVALESGEVYAVQTTNEVAAIPGLLLEIGELEPGQPAAVYYDGTSLPVLLPAGEDISPLTHPVVTEDGNLLYVAENGDLVLWQNGAALAREPLGIQRDARLVLNTEGDIAVYAGATNERYVHGIMGDDVEGSELVIVDPSGGNLNILAQSELPGQDVFEGISPLWADIDGDDVQEVITTVSNGDVGAWIRAYAVNGEVLAESNPIGQGQRWRHQLAVAPFGPNGETQLVDVRTPHIGGMVEFFDLADDTLEVNNAQLGYTSHVIGSRNLDQGIAGDFNGNSKPELIVTDQSQQNVTALENTEQGVVEVWRLPITESGNRLVTNFAAVRLPNGTLALAAGADNNILRVWR